MEELHPCKIRLPILCRAGVDGQGEKEEGEGEASSIL